MCIAFRNSILKSIFCSSINKHQPYVTKSTADKIEDFRVFVCLFPDLRKRCRCKEVASLVKNQLDKN